jgi:hypothetical protein
MQLRFSLQVLALAAFAGAIDAQHRHFDRSHSDC